MSSFGDFIPLPHFDPSLSGNPFTGMNSAIQKRRPLYVLTLIAGASALAFSISDIAPDHLTAGLLVIAVVMVVMSWITHVKLGQKGIHLTLSEVLVFFLIFSYGGAIATMIAAIEAAFSAVAVKRRGSDDVEGSVMLSAAIAALATFATVSAAERLLGTPPETANLHNDTELVVLLSLMVATQFLTKSVLWAAFAGANSSERFWKIWYERCLNGIALYVVGAFVAGVIVRASFGRDPVLIIAALVVGAVVFFTYRRHVSEVRQHHLRAERAESSRADDARRHVEALKRQILKLEQTESALRGSEARFRRAAYHDQLTDLPNQNLLQLEIEKANARRRKTGKFNFAVLYVDLNRFKGINETLGHRIADEFLIGVAERLSDILRPDDFLARVSGDEFAIIAAGIDDVREAEELAELLIGKLAAPFNVKGKILFTSVSIGIALRNKMQSSNDIVRDAQIALYKAKSLEIPYAVFDQKMYDLAVHRMQIETQLRGALERGEFEPYFQPIVELSSMELAGFEALLRWRHPQQGLLGPGTFMTVCEDTGLIVPITTWMLQESCRTLARWMNSTVTNREIFMSVNLSAKDFGQSDLIENVSKILGETGIRPHCLKLEITESAVMTNAEAAIEILRRVKRLGVRLSVDDFGTGYSSLSYLHRFPVDTLKVDRSFVSSMEFGSENGEIVRTVIALAKLLGMKIISEGIESVHQLHQLKILECEYGQGFLFSAPVPEPEARAMLLDRNRWKGLSPEGVPEIRIVPGEDTLIRLDDGSSPPH